MTPRWRDQEPVTFFTAISDGCKTVVLAVITLALAFNWVNWSDEQIAAVIGVVAAVFVLLSTMLSVITRNRVTPIANPRAMDGTPLVKEDPPATR